MNQRHQKLMMPGRSGVLKLEALLGCLILLVAMNLASTMIYRINLVWGETQRYQFAMNELSNQIEPLTRLNADDAESAIESLTLSEDCKASLPGAVIFGTLVDDDLGTRIDLSLNWESRKPGKPVRLSSWLSESIDKADQ